MEVLSTRADFAGIAGVTKLPVDGKDRRMNRMGAIGCAIRKLEDMSSGNLTKAVNMSPRGENAEGK